MHIDEALSHFTDFHSGTVNIVVHIIGFLGLFYSIYIFNWVLFAVSILVLESGHVYNHVAGIKPYDFRPKTIFWRVVIFIAVVVAAYLVSEYLLIGK
jgi:hypothetical protein